MVQAHNDDTLSVRPASDDDLGAVLAIERVCYPEPCIAWTEEAFRQEIEKPFSNFLVLTDDATDTILTGYIVFWLLFDECHILNVAVHPDWRGLGIATRLVRHAVAAAVKKDMKRVFLEVRKTNTPAVELYQRLGFFVDHVKPTFYENGDDAYFMVLYLNKSNVF
ncbi:MAG: ribosomal protein S18-alanine N-acetyltransferase [Deltaproteobacteria bacterium]|nr:ribosomal protein S18-alanine N-acetyltransferase [Deltaproteobacteria bacterium]